MKSLSPDTYAAFQEAIFAGDAPAARAHATHDFRASLGSDKKNLTVEQLINEINRLREVFPDLGKTIDTVSTIVDTPRHWVTLTYRMTVTYHGKTISVAQQDRVTFDAQGDKIAALEIVYDAPDTLRQMS